MDLTGIQEVIVAVVALIAVVALVYAIARGRRRSAASKLIADARTRGQYTKGNAAERSETSPTLVPPAPKDPADRLTEDQMQQATLGGIKGSPDLKTVQMSEKERANTFG